MILSDEETTELKNLLCHIAQIFDGWHSDGTAWSEWDEQVRQRLSAEMMIFESDMNQRIPITKGETMTAVRDGMMAGLIRTNEDLKRKLAQADNRLIESRTLNLSLKEQLEFATKNAYCVYCGTITEKDEQKMAEHILACEKHPANIALGLKIKLEEMKRKYDDKVERWQWYGLEDYEAKVERLETIARDAQTKCGTYMIEGSNLRKQISTLTAENEKLKEWVRELEEQV